MPRAGDTLGPYILIKKIGRGGFGEVWLAERRTAITTTTAALKIPHSEDIDLDGIKHEANLWVKASGHINVLPIIEADIYGDRVVIASEYAPDGSVESWVKSLNGKIPPLESVIDVTLGVLAGLEHLHARDIIHRDLKPANILFQGVTPRITDFGISRVLKSTSNSIHAAGTPAYMAPEAFSGKRNKKTDLWSIGAMLYHLLSGHLPFPQTDYIELIGAICTREPEPLPASIPKAFGTLISQALAKDSNQRFQSASEMRNALKTAIKISNKNLEVRPVIKRPYEQISDSEDILGILDLDQKPLHLFTPEMKKLYDNEKHNFKDDGQRRYHLPELFKDLSDYEQRQHKDARRFANLLVSEIKLYNEDALKEGRRNKDIYFRLKEDIDRSRQIYNKRATPKVKERFDYFYYEIVYILCEGDPSKLGISTPI